MPTSREVTLANNDQRRRRRVAPARKSQEQPALVIADQAQLRDFAASRAFASKQPLILNMPGMPPKEAFAAGERLNKDRSECGCSLGAQAMTAAFLISLVLPIVRYGVLTAAMLKRVPIAVAAALVFAALGKCAGIAIARRRARREVAHMLATFTCS